MAELEAVNGLNITVQPGRCYGFFGRNGAGKTTTIKCLLNLLQPTSGTARVSSAWTRNDRKSRSNRASPMCRTASPFIRG